MAPAPTPTAALLSPDEYLMPNGCILRRGHPQRVPAEMIWRIPAVDREALGLDLDHDRASSDSEVVIWPAAPAPPG